MTAPAIARAARGRFDLLRLALHGEPPGSASSLAPTLLASAIDLHPHQIEAAVFALGRPCGRGAILADEVGLGKTIEAGLVIAQRLAEGAERVLVLVPASLRTQWRDELARCFGIGSRLVDLGMLRRERLRSTRGVHVASLGFFAGDSVPSWFRDADWDLVVIDEAHRLRNVWQPGARRARRLRELLRGRRKLLLTATPFQNSLLELYGLVSFVDETLFGGEAGFRARFLEDDRGRVGRNEEELRERLSGVLVRTLRRQVLDTIRFTSRRSLLYDFEPLPAERELYEKVSRYFAESRVVAVAFGTRELLLLAYRKILASSTFAVAETLRRLVVTLVERLRRTEAPAAPLLPEPAGAEPARPDDGDEEPTGDEPELEARAGAGDEPADAPLTRDEIEGEIAELRSYIALADSITRNAKGDRLVRALAEVFALARAKGWPEKAVVFTESRRTQEYLSRLLESSGFAGLVTRFHGGSGDAAARAALVEEFRTRTRVLLATEAGAEGLNLQFCNVVVNFDLPWNPQRIEQRIGRCHRYGQALDVLVVNFLNTSNAADRRLYELLSTKLALFDGVFGASDDVLGSLESGLDFERRVLEIYANCRTADAIDQAFDGLGRDIEAASSRRLAAAQRLLLDHFDDQVRARLAGRREALIDELHEVSERVRELVVDGAVAAEPEPDGGAWRIEWPADLVLRVPAGDLPARVRFAPGAGGGALLGPRHPAVTALEAWLRASEGPPVVHELMVHAPDDLAGWRGRRGYWFTWEAHVTGAPGGRRLLDVAHLEGESAPLDAAETEALAAAPRDHRGHAPLAPPERLTAAAERTVAARLLEIEAAARAGSAALLEDEERRLERVASEARAAGEIHLERARGAFRRADERRRELEADPRAGEGARREAASIADLLEGQLRYEERLLEEDDRRRRREREARVAALRVSLEVRSRRTLVAQARFWLV